MTKELTPDQLSVLKKGLDELADQLRELLESTEDGTAPVKLKDNQGRLSRMDELHNQSILVANRTVAQNRLKAVLQAQQRMKDNDYAICEDCDEPIGFPRLEAYPDASKCVACQSDAEKQ